MELLTNTVGSYPTYTIGETTKAQMGIQDLMRGRDPFVASVKAAVEDQIKAGIDLISDGQVRADMVSMFAANIPGMKSVKGRSYIIGKIGKPLKSVVASDLSIAAECAAHKAKLKGILTGPVTLSISSSLSSGTPYKSRLDPHLLSDLATALHSEAESLIRAGAAALQIDEPVLFNIDFEKTLPYIDAVAEDLAVPVKLHPHVASSEAYKPLLSLNNVQFIGVEAAKYPAFLETLTGEEFEEHGKQVALGVIDTDSQEVEALDTVQRRIERGIEVFGESMWINPDCGMRLLTRETAFAKLKTMVDAVNVVRGEFS